MAYSFVTFAQAKTDLAQRLADPGGVFWTATERGAYIVEALRMRNALTSAWVQDFTFNAPVAPGQIWYNFNAIANSPRTRTVTDTDLYTMMEYHLLEPPTGGTWSGTAQFSITDLSAALQRRRDEILQVAYCNMAVASQAASMQRRNLLADTALELKRVRFLPNTGSIALIFTLFGAAPTIPAGDYQVSILQFTGVSIDLVQQGAVSVAAAGPNQALNIVTTVPNPYAAVSWKIYASADGWVTTYVWTFNGPLIAPATGVNLNFGAATVTTGYPPLQTFAPTTLQMADNLALEYFQDGYGQETGIPETWGIVAEPPLAFDVDVVPAVPGSYEIIALNSGASLAPPAATPVGVPDDFSWVAKWGAMADLLTRESEATDRARAAYCLERYRDGLRLMAAAPWLLLAKIDGIPVDTPPVEDMDMYGIEWDSRSDAEQVIVVGGVDFLAVSPVPITPSVGVTVTVVGNAPVPVVDGDFLQVGRDAYDQILNYAQHLAAFKMGGQEFADTMPLVKEFYESAKYENARLEPLGLFRDVLLQDRQAVREE